jgi:hypothetical protein
LTPIANMVLEMIARGVDTEVIGMAVSAAEQVLIEAARHVTSRDESVTHRRESDRLRKKRSRDRLVTERDVTGQSQVPLSKSSLEEEKREALSADVTPWFPADSDWQSAVDLLTEPIASSELTKFRNINRRPPGPRRDDAWRVWVQRAVEYQAKMKAATAAATNGAALVEDDKFWESAINSWKKFGRWPAQHCGPDPESPACRCPREVLERHGICP